MIWILYAFVTLVVLIEKNRLIKSYVCSLAAAASQTLTLSENIPTQKMTHTIDSQTIFDVP